MCCLFFHKVLFHNFVFLYFSMNTKYSNVAPSPIYPFACQLLLHLHKKCSSYIYSELSFAQIVSFHYMLFLPHISKMMTNATMTLQPTTKYSTHLHILLISTPFLLLLFLTILLPPPTFVYVHSYVLPFPLLFVVVFQLHYLHSW